MLLKVLIEIDERNKSSISTYGISPSRSNRMHSERYSGGEVLKLANQ